MVIYAKSNADGGAIVRYYRHEEAFRRKGEPRAGAFDPSNTVWIDFGQNPSVLADMDAAIEDFTVASGVLKQGGSNVAVAADGDAAKDRNRMRTALASLDDGSITGAQLRKVVASLIRRLRREGVL